MAERHTTGPVLKGRDRKQKTPSSQDLVICGDDGGRGAWCGEALAGIDRPIIMEKNASVEGHTDKTSFR